MGRGAALIMLRAARAWKIAVPGLRSCERLALTSSAQTSSVSEGNLKPDDFEMICGALTGE